jgi:uncharacterized protein YqgC (DUF456 family)
MDSLALLGLAVVGAVELIKRLFKKDFEASALIAGAAIVGAIGGYFLGIPVFQGLIIGLTGSGFITTASYISNKG